MIISERQVAYENWRLFELFELFEFCLSLVAVSHSQIMTVDGGEDSELAMQRRFDSVHQILKLLFDVHCSQTHQTINSTFGSCSFFSRSAIFNINRRLSFSLAKIGEITNGEILRALDVRVFAQWAAEWSLAWAKIEGYYTNAVTVVTRIADDSKVYRHELITNIGETAGVVEDIGSDPTLPRSDKQCPKCGNTECVFFQSQQKRNDTSMVLFFVCLDCKNVFRSQ
ncbi:unnamed protein product [[Candida] boidinii]|uniref:DNA-directed RNA polymerase II subunit RPB9 n=1 Tax=Candida boidinii TaxID=5477 RepID=A0A9W6T2G3_CANBO|nr:unnamed protein product [[Candida] boidinii]